MLMPSWRMRLLSCYCIFLFFGLTFSADVSSFLRQGDAALSSGSYNEAITQYTAAIDIDSGSPLLHTKRAAAYIILRQQANALRDLNKALEMDPNNIQGYIHRGKVLKQMCSLEAAQKDYESVLAIKPEHKSATKEMEAVKKVSELLAKAKERKEQGDLDGARQTLELLFEEAQDCVEGQLIEADISAERKEYEQTIAVTGKIIKSEPGHLKALVMRGTAYYYMNDHDLAKRHFGEALKYDPDHQEARTLFNKVKAFDRKVQAAGRAKEAQDWPEAEKLFSEALHLDVLHRKAAIGLWFGLGKARSALGKHEEAALAYKNVQVLQSGHQEAMEEEIRSLLAASQFQEAVTRAREAVNTHQQLRSFRQLLHDAERQLKISQRKDYYKILGVTREADERDIKRAYRDLARRLHPDKVPESEKKASEDLFTEVAQAYEVLSDTTKRQRYDAGEDPEPAPQQHHHHQQFHQFYQFNFD